MADRYQRLEGQEPSSSTARPQELNTTSHGESKQTRIPFSWRQGFWWLLTVIVCAFILVTIWIYEQKGNVTIVQKHTFNTIITGLILGLGLNFFEAFKSFAKASRESILAQPHLSYREKELIESIENLTSVCVLGFTSRKTWIVLFCVAWIFLNILAQTAVAIISLTFSINDGTSYNDTYIRPGTVNASALTCYDDYFNHGHCGGPIMNQSLAHAYGDLALISDCGNYTEISDVLDSKYNYGYYCRRTRYQQEFAYRFNEYNPKDKTKAYPRFTNRTITASAGECFNYSMTGDPVTLGGGDLLFEFSNDTFKGNITIPAAYGALDGTTYIYRGLNVPQQAIEYACGPRCIKMWAHRSEGYGENSTFFECPITVNEVNNATEDYQRLSYDMARLAAASIALQGRPSGLVGPSGTNIWPQYQFYAFGSAYETHFRSADQVGADMAEFAIGSISTMASTNRQIQVPSLVPHLGSSLKVHWYYVIFLLSSIAGVHLALFIANSSRVAHTSSTSSTHVPDADESSSHKIPLLPLRSQQTASQPTAESWTGSSNEVETHSSTGAMRRTGTF